ncbi:MAG: hypothetical protein AAF648_09850 [Pseudomonadota bacterium]
MEKPRNPKNDPEGSQDLSLLAIETAGEVATLVVTIAQLAVAEAAGNVHLLRRVLVCTLFAGTFLVFAAIAFEAFLFTLALETGSAPVAALFVLVSNIGLALAFSSQKSRAFKEMGMRHTVSALKAAVVGIRSPRANA